MNQAAIRGLCTMIRIAETEADVLDTRLHLVRLAADRRRVSKTWRIPVLGLCRPYRDVRQKLDSLAAYDDFLRRSRTADG
jgi:hypothetical protein